MRVHNQHRFNMQTVYKGKNFFMAYNRQIMFKKVQENQTVSEIVPEQRKNKINQTLYLVDDEWQNVLWRRTELVPDH